MKTKLIFILFALILSGSINAIGQGCAQTSNIYTFMHEGKTYLIVKEMKTWANAAACAVELGGYLAEINNSDEQEAIYDEIISGANISPNYTTVPDGGGVAYIWIGATDQAEEGKWLWDGNNDGAGINFWQGQGNAGAGGGHPVADAYNNWGGASTGTRHEPDNYNGLQDGAAIALRGWPSGSGTLGIEGEWNDINLTNTLYFVVEKEAPSGMNDQHHGKTINIYPNPVKDLLTIKVQRSNVLIQSAIVFDLTGKEIVNCKYSDRKFVELDLGQYARGVYCVSVALNDGRVVNERIVLL